MSKNTALAKSKIFIWTLFGQYMDSVQTPPQTQVQRGVWLQMQIFFKTNI